jgi:phosphomannomutase
MSNSDLYTSMEGSNMRLCFRGKKSGGCIDLLWRKTVESCRSRKFYRRLCALFVVVTFITGVIVPPGGVFAQGAAPAVLNLPVPGTMVLLTPGYQPALIKGMTIYPDDPLKFDFIINSGETRLEGEPLKEVSTKLIKYFMASLTVPERDVWVNLSPREKDRIIPEGFGTTEMGRDLLVQDYLLKQLSASLMYPEDELGKKFWKRVYEKVRERFGTAEIPVNTFNKIWIVPRKAVVYEHGRSAFIVESSLKVMLEEDYETLKAARRAALEDEPAREHDVSEVSSEVIREILIPEIEKEVNEGETFANLRQIYHSMILAAWYKQRLKESLLGRVYVDRNKTKGIDVEDKEVKRKIYEQYLAAFKKGVYNYIKEDYDPVAREVVPRKYISGGMEIKIRPEIEDSVDSLGSAALVSLIRNHPELSQDESKSIALRMREFSSDERKEVLTKVDFHTDPAKTRVVQAVLVENVGDEQLAEIEPARTVPPLASSPVKGEKNTYPLAKTRKVIFGTSGDRGKFGDDFTIDLVRRLAEGTARYIKESDPRKQVLIGFDTRQGNLNFARETAVIMAGHGIEVRIIADAPTPTPVLTYLAGSNDKIGGVVNLTASHSSFEDSGFKFSPEHGGAADAEVTSRIQLLANEAENYKFLDYGLAKTQGFILEMTQREAMDIYVNQYIIPTLKRIGAFDDIVNYIKNNPGFRVVLDPMQGAGVEYMRAIYAEIAKAAGRDFFELIHENNRDSRFSEVNGRPQPDAKDSRKALEDQVKKAGGNALGIAVDGDADRFGVVDFDGEFIPADFVLGMLGYFLKTEKNMEGAIGKTVVTSNFLNDVAKHLDLPLHETPVGFKHMVDLAVNHGVKFLVAGEESAHGAVGPFMESFDDGLAVGLTVLWMAAKTGKTLGQYRSDIFKLLGKEYHKSGANISQEGLPVPRATREVVNDVNSALSDGISIQAIPLILQIQKETGQKVHNIITKDGLKIVFETTGDWLAMRPSGTEPVGKVYEEVTNASRKEMLLEAGKKVILEKAESLNSSSSPVEKLVFLRNFKEFSRQQKFLWRGVNPLSHDNGDPEKKIVHVKTRRADLKRKRTAKKSYSPTPNQNEKKITTEILTLTGKLFKNPKYRESFVEAARRYNQDIGRLMSNMGILLMGMRQFVADTKKSNIYRTHARRVFGGNKSDGLKAAEPLVLAVLMELTLGKRERIFDTEYKPTDVSKNKQGRPSRISDDGDLDFDPAEMLFEMSDEETKRLFEIIEKIREEDKGLPAYAWLFQGFKKGFPENVAVSSPVSDPYQLSKVITEFGLFDKNAFEFIVEKILKDIKVISGANRIQYWVYDDKENMSPKFRQSREILRKSTRSIIQEYLKIDSNQFVTITEKDKRYEAIEIAGDPQEKDTKLASTKRAIEEVFALIKFVMNLTQKKMWPVIDNMSVEHIIGGDSGLALSLLSIKSTNQAEISQIKEIVAEMIKIAFGSNQNVSVGSQENGDDTSITVKEKNDDYEMIVREISRFLSAARHIGWVLDYADFNMIRQVVSLVEKNRWEEMGYVKDLIGQLQGSRVGQVSSESAILPKQSDKSNEAIRVILKEVSEAIGTTFLELSDMENMENREDMSIEWFSDGEIEKMLFVLHFAESFIDNENSRQKKAESMLKKTSAQIASFLNKEQYKGVFPRLSEKYQRNMPELLTQILMLLREFVFSASEGQKRHYQEQVKRVFGSDDNGALLAAEPLVLAVWLEIFLLNSSPEKNQKIFSTQYTLNDFLSDAVEDTRTLLDDESVKNLFNIVKHLKTTEKELPAHVQVLKDLNNGFPMSSSPVGGDEKTPDFRRFSQLYQNISGILASEKDQHMAGEITRNMSRNLSFPSVSNGALTIRYREKRAPNSNLAQNILLALLKDFHIESSIPGTRKLPDGASLFSMQVKGDERLLQSLETEIRQAISLINAVDNVARVIQEGKLEVSLDELIENLKLDPVDGVQLIKKVAHLYSGNSNNMLAILREAAKAIDSLWLPDLILKGEAYGMPEENLNAEDKERILIVLSIAQEKLNSFKMIPIDGNVWRNFLQQQVSTTLYDNFATMMSESGSNPIKKDVESQMRLFLNDNSNKKIFARVAEQRMASLFSSSESFYQSVIESLTEIRFLSEGNPWPISRFYKDQVKRVFGNDDSDGLRRAEPLVLAVWLEFEYLDHLSEKNQKIFSTQYTLNDFLSGKAGRLFPHAVFSNEKSVGKFFEIVEYLKTTEKELPAHVQVLKDLNNGFPMSSSPVGEDEKTPEKKILNKKDTSLYARLLATHHVSGLTDRKRVIEQMLKNLGSIIKKEEKEYSMRKILSSSPIDEANKIDTGDNQPPLPPGGIDLTAVRDELQIRRDSRWVPLPLSRQPIETMRIDGFLPVIINITPPMPMPDARLILGLVDAPVGPSDGAGSPARSRAADRRLKFTRLEKYDFVGRTA